VKMPTEMKESLQPAMWVKSFGDYLLSYAMIKVGNRETAEDLVQETFLAAVKAIDSFKAESSEKTWLVAILKNKIIDHYRKHDVLKNASQYISETEEEFTGHYFDKTNGHWLKSSAPQDWDSSPEKAINSSEFEQVLQMCIHKMPRKLIPIFVAKFIDDEDSEEICKVHDISTSNYWVIIHRAKVLVRSCLEKNWFRSQTELTSKKV